MSQPDILMLTYPPAWAAELRRHFPAEQVDIVVKARRPGACFLAEHDLYEPGRKSVTDVPDQALREIELSLRRCYTGSVGATRGIALQILGNAERMLAQKNYRRIIFRTVPHMPHEFALYHCAKARNIETAFFDETGYFQRAFVYQDIYRREPSSATEIPGSATFSFTPEQREIASLNDLRKNYHGLRKVGQGPVRNLLKIARAYLYVIKASIVGDNIAGSAGLSRNILNNNLIDRLVFWTKAIARTAVLRAVLNRLESRGPRQAPVRDSIVFLLNFQPERTTLPDAFPYYDLLQGFEELGRTGRPVFIKEHPIQLNFPGDGALLRGATWRSKAFYESLDERSAGFLPRTREVDEALATHNVLATTTGTVAVEMFFRKIPVLVLANNWVSSLPNVLRTSTLDADQPILAYEPFETFETIFRKTVKVVHWADLSEEDIAVLRVLVDGDPLRKEADAGL